MLAEYSTLIPLILATELSDKTMWIWIKRNTEQGWGIITITLNKINSYYQMKNPYSQSKEKVEQTIP